MFFKGAAWRSAGEQGAVQSDAGGGALVAGGGLQRSGSGQQQTGGKMESPSQEGGAPKHKCRQEEEAKEQVRERKHGVTSQVLSSINYQIFFKC